VAERRSAGRFEARSSLEFRARASTNCFHHASANVKKKLAPFPIRLLFIIWFIRYLFRTKQAQLRLAVAER
jgi:hypothetical protein